MMMTIGHPPPREPHERSQGAGRPAPHSPPAASPHFLGPLSAMFRREFLPHVPAALCVPAIVVAAIGLKILSAHMGSAGNVPGDPLNVLLNDVVRWAVMIGCPVVGLIMGGLQARADLAPTMWAFIAHRPAPRAILFLGRALAGLALYGIAAGVPVGALLAYATTSAAGVPFHWTFFLPTLADFLTGLVFYFAGWLVVQRAALLFGSRALPVVGAIACSVLVAFTPTFGAAMGVLALFVAAYGGAAYGAQSSHGFRLRTAWPARLACTLVLLVSLMAVGNVIGLTGAALAHVRGQQQWEDFLSSGPHAPEPQYDSAFPTTRYQILPDGTLGKSIHTPPPAGQSEITESDVEKHTTYVRVGPPEEPVQVDSDALRNMWRHEATVSRAVVPDTPPYRDLDANLITRRIAAFERWYYVTPQGLFLGYDVRTGGYLGSIGEDGFAPPGSAATPFRVLLNSNADGPNLELRTPHGIFQVDLQQHTTKVVRHFPVGPRGVSWGHAPDGSFDVARSGDTLLVYLQGDQSPRKTVPLAAGNYDLRVLHFPEDQRWVLWYMPQGDWSRNNRIEFYDESWKLLSEVELASMDPRYTQQRQAWRAYQDANGITRMIHEETALTAISHAIGGMPGIQFVGRALNPRQLELQRLLTAGGNGELNSDMAALLKDPWYAVPAGGVLMLSAAVMAGFAWRYQVRGRWVWIAGTLLFGPLIILLLASTHTWPRRVRCGVCGKWRFISAEHCAHCAAPFAGPPGAGTEVFSAVSGGAA